MADIQRDKRWSELDSGISLAHHSLYRKITPIVMARPPGRLLEVGCLDGKFLRSLDGTGWELVGLDIQPQDDPRIVEHDAAEPFPFGPEFDVVVAAEVIEHIVDTYAFLDHCAYVLKPGGTLVLTTPNLAFGVNRLRLLVGKRPKFAYADYHVRMFIWSDLSEKISHRFTIDSLGGSHLLVGRHHGSWAEVFSRAGDRFPKLAAHLIVTATKR